MKKREDGSTWIPTFGSLCVVYCWIVIGWATIAAIGLVKTRPSAIVTKPLATTPQDLLRQLTALDHHRHHHHDEEDVVMGCIETKDCRATIGNSFVIGDCNETNHECGVDISLVVDFGNIGEDEPIIGQMSLRMDPTMCMQATHGGVLTHGAWMRVYPCDRHNSLQRFRFFAGDIRLAGSGWCITHHGVQVNHYDDHIMVASCRSLRRRARRRGFNV